MAFEALSLAETVFSDIQKSNERYVFYRGNAGPNVKDPTSYVLDMPGGSPKLITGDIYLLGLTGIHLSKVEETDKIEATRIVSPGFDSMLPFVMNAVVDFHKTDIEKHRTVVPPGIQAQRDKTFRVAQEKLLEGGNTLAGGVAAWLCKGNVEVNMFYPLSPFKGVRLKEIRAQIARHSFKASEFNELLILTSENEQAKANDAEKRVYLRAVPGLPAAEEPVPKKAVA